jgi:hypothetical protein
MLAPTTPSEFGRYEYRAQRRGKRRKGALNRRGGNRIARLEKRHPLGLGPWGGEPASQRARRFSRRAVLGTGYICSWCVYLHHHHHRLT